jgi:transcriptional regulator with PAS, ATPase and Fis domain
MLESTRPSGVGARSTDGPPRELLSIVGTSPSVELIRDLVRTVAANHSTILIHGESGVGKELIARAIHGLSPRRDQPFVATNCGALPESLLESQLFGHVKGAFTGATADTLGIFRAADRGTIFLDEITEMSQALQVKLLRVLQEREITPVGATDAVRVDVRIIAATNHPLEGSGLGDVLREDLYYRLSVVQVHVPPLRQRREDIEPLLNHFNYRHAIAYAQSPLVFSAGAIRRLVGYSWPGNVRELSNVVERFFALHAGPSVDVGDLPPAIARAGDLAEAPAKAPDPDHVPTLEEAERDLIARALKRTGGQKLAAAKLLNVERHRLARKMNKYGLR